MEVYPGAVPFTVEPQSGELRVKRELFDPERVLGSLAVRPFEPGWNIATEREKARKKLASFDSTNGQILARYLNGMMPLSLQESISAQEKLQDRQLSWRTWFQRHANDDEVLLFLREHQDVVLELTNSDATAAQIDALQSRFVQGSDFLFHDGSLGSEPRHTLGLSIVFGDIFDTILKERGGYYEHSSHEIVIAQGYQTAREKYISEVVNGLPAVLTHEFVHGLLGTALYDKESPMSNRWINEALTEEISKRIRKQSGEDVQEDNVYIDERNLLRTLLEPVKKNAEIWRMAMQAYSGSDDHRAAFIEEIDRIWASKDVVLKVSSAVSLEERRIAAGGIVNQAVQNAALKRVSSLLHYIPTNVLLQGMDHLREEPSAATPPQ